jgi:hypothetical protein
MYVYVYACTHVNKICWAHTRRKTKKHAWAYMDRSKDTHVDHDYEKHTKRIEKGIKRVEDCKLSYILAFNLCKKCDTQVATHLELVDTFCAIFSRAFLDCRSGLHVRMLVRSMLRILLGSWDRQRKAVVHRADRSMVSLVHMVYSCVHAGIIIWIQDA